MKKNKFENKKKRRLRKPMKWKRLECLMPTWVSYSDAHTEANDESDHTKEHNNQNDDHDHFLKSCRTTVSRTTTRIMQGRQETKQRRNQCYKEFLQSATPHRKEGREKGKGGGQGDLRRREGDPLAIP
jgi:hypothetical protein